MKVYPPEFEALIVNGSAIALEVETPPVVAMRCPNCAGLGVMYVFKMSGQPSMSPAGSGSKWMDIDGRAGWWQGKTDTAPCPVCATGRVRDWIKTVCGLRGNDFDVSLEDFSVRGDKAAKADALTVARELLADNRQPKGFLIFHGGYGVGKTHLLMGLVNGFVNIGVYAKYALLSDLLDEIREKFGERRGRDAQVVLEHYRDIRVLCIDELDKVNLTEWALETISRLVVDREQRKGELLTVMASNTAPARLPDALGYLRSRLSGGMCIEVPGPDVRLEKGQPLGSINLPKLRDVDPTWYEETDKEPEYGNYPTEGITQTLTKRLGTNGH